MGSSGHKLYLMNNNKKKQSGFFSFLFLCIENCRVFTTSHLIHHSDRGPWLDQSSKIFASNNVEIKTFFITVSTFRKKWDVALL